VEIDTFDVAFHIIGGGEEGAKTEIRSKEEADHSLPYMVAAALLDGELMPAQYTDERIGRDDVQRLLRRVSIRPDAGFSERFPDQMPVRVRISLRDGRRFETERSEYEGFHSHPLSWESVVAKFDRLASPHCGQQRRADIVRAVHDCDSTKVRALTSLLSDLQPEIAA
jgi:2-methylcitrate dehydratase